MVEKCFLGEWLAFSGGSEAERTIENEHDHVDIDFGLGEVCAAVRRDMTSDVERKRYSIDKLGRLPYASRPCFGR